MKLLLQEQSLPIESQVSIAPTAESRPVLVWIAMGVLTAIVALLLCYEITEPFIGHHDFNSAYMSTAAKNHLRYGFLTTKFGLVVDNGPQTPQQFTYYTHHPPLIPIFVSFFFALFGAHEWAARLTPILFSVGSLVLVYLIGRQLLDRTLGVISALLFGFYPMTLYFGRMLDFEAPTEFFVLATVLAYIHWQREKTLRCYCLMIAAFVVTSLCFWPGYYLAAVLPAHCFLVSRRQGFDRRILILPAIGILLFLGHLGHIFLLNGNGSFADLWQRLLLRAGLSSRPFEWRGFVVRHMHRLPQLYTWPALLAALAYPVISLRPSRRFALTDPFLIPALLAFGVMHVALFTQGAWVHDYWTFYLAAGLALAGGVSIVRLSESKLGLAVCGLTLILFIWTGISTMMVMHTWDFNSDRLGLWLKAHTQPQEEILKSAGVIWWDVTDPRTLYYAERNGVAREPVTSLKALDEILNKRSQEHYAFILFNHGADVPTLDVRGVNEQAAAAMRERLIREFPVEECEFEGNRFEIFRIGPSLAALNRVRDQARSAGRR